MIECFSNTAVSISIRQPQIIDRSYYSLDCLLYNQIPIMLRLIHINIDANLRVQTIRFEVDNAYIVLKFEEFVSNGFKPPYKITVIDQVNVNNFADLAGHRIPKGSGTTFYAFQFDIRGLTYKFKSQGHWDDLGFQIGRTDVLNPSVKAPSGGPINL